MTSDVILPNSATSPSLDPTTSPGPFEGPEKLLEVWFAPSADALSTNAAASSSSGAKRQRDGKDWRGLRQVPRAVWEEMLDIVKCKVLSVVEGEEIDAYLLSESSLFVAPHLIILKTCGTTLNLLGLHRIIEIAREYCGFSNIWRCFYSRKSFFFPERQSGPHKDWRDEVNFLDGIFGAAGTAYIVGPMNRDHWLLYLTSPNTLPLLPSPTAPLTSSQPARIPSSPLSPTSAQSTARIVYEDTTLEILMSHLRPAGREPFFPSTSESEGSVGGHELGRRISSELGIDRLFPADETTLDSFGFDPCGYSANAVVGSGLPGSGSGEGEKGGGYFTIHVTPEEGWSYASFECNVPLPSAGDEPSPTSNGAATSRPDLPTLIRKVVDIFQPNRLSITLFVSTPTPLVDSDKAADHDVDAVVAGSVAAGGSGGGVGGQGTGSAASKTAEIEGQAWKAFRGDMLGKDFERKDRIGYEFVGYDLVFACFERRGWVEPVGAKGGMGLA